MELYAEHLVSKIELRKAYYGAVRACFIINACFKEDCFNDKDVQNIAKSIYKHNNYKDTPILADALEDVGCSNSILLSHLRLGFHIRGCWAIDSILNLQY